jgi:hypothetical protein
MLKDWMGHFVAEYKRKLVIVFNHVNKTSEYKQIAALFIF